RVRGPRRRLVRRRPDRPRRRERRRRRLEAGPARGPPRAPQLAVVGAADPARRTGDDDAAGPGHRPRRPRPARAGRVEPPGLRRQRHPGSHNQRRVNAMPSEDDDWRSANRDHWDYRTDVHVRSRFYYVERWLRERPGSRNWEAQALGDVSGLDFVHLQCHFGLDTLAWARVGARVTGLDFSPAAIEAACDFARRAGLAEHARFVCGDVYEATDLLGVATYDVVYVSLGA